MANSDCNTIEDLQKAYAEGKREFENWDFEEDGSAEGLDLSGIEFKHCFLFLDFKNANLANAKFISCNLKTADFSGANLENALIKNCLVESTRFEGAKLDNFQFEENYYFGATVGQKDFEAFFRDTDG